MKYITLKHKIVYANIAAAVLLCAITLLSIGKNDRLISASLTFGFYCLLLGGLDMFVGIILAISKVKDWDIGFIISGGILLLLSGISCSSGLLLSSH